MNWNGDKPTESVIYDYDALQSKISSKDIISGTTLTATFSYDENYASTGRGAVTIDPSSGAMTSVTRDSDGLLTSVTNPQGKINYIYDAVTGRLVETWRGTLYSTATTDTRYGYDAQGRLASTTIVKQAGAAPSLTVSAIPYLDAVGNSITPRRTGRARCTRMMRMGISRKWSIPTAPRPTRITPATEPPPAEACSAARASQTCGERSPAAALMRIA